MLIREIDAEWRSYGATGGETLEQFANYFLRNFNLSEQQKSYVIGDLKNTQQQIADLYDDYFYEQHKLLIEKGFTVPPKFTEADFNKIVSLTAVDFPLLNDSVRKDVLFELKRAVAGDYGYASFRQKLINRKLGETDASTLANTSLAGFDNQYHIEGAQQAGAEYFLYDGILVEHSRDFCIERVKGVYTIAELKGMNNKQGLDVIPFLGGYNCIHFLTALFGYQRLIVGEKYNEAHHKFLDAA